MAAVAAPPRRGGNARCVFAKRTCLAAVRFSSRIKKWRRLQPGQTKFSSGANRHSLSPGERVRVRASVNKIILDGCGARPSGRFNPNSEVAAVPPPGSTGNLPVPRGDPPRGTGRRARYFLCALGPGDVPALPSGQWPSGTGGSPVPPSSISEFGFNGRWRGTGRNSDACLGANGEAVPRAGPRPGA